MMLSCDSNILIYAMNPDTEEHGASRRFLTENLSNKEFAVSEWVLMEVYNLIRNPVVMPKTLSASEAVGAIQAFRQNRYWTQLKGTTDVSDRVWSVANSNEFPRRAIFDARIAFDLAANGVKRFATRNVADFERFGLFEVFDPIAG